MSTGFTFQHPETGDDYEQIYGVMRKAFTDEPVDEMVRRFAERHPEMKKEHFFMVKHGGEAVAALILIPQTWILDGVELRVAEMGCVGTAPEYQKRGLQKLLNKHFDEHARSNGYDLCAIAGIPYFYRQFGYTYAVDLDFKTTVETDQIPDKGPSLRVKEFTKEDIPEAHKLLESGQSNYLVHSKRTPELWQVQHSTGTYGGEPYHAYSMYDEDEMVGYYRLSNDKGALILKEMGYRSSKCIQEALWLLKKQAENYGLKWITSKLSHVHPITHELLKHGGVKNKPYAWQVKVADYEGVFRKLKPALERRIENSRYQDLCEPININFWKFNIRLDLLRGKIVQIEAAKETLDRSTGLNPAVFPQLLLGYRTVEELEYAYPDCRVNPSQEELLNTLFPRGPGFIHYCY